MRKTRRESIGDAFPALRRERDLLLKTLEAFREEDLGFHPPAPAGVEMLDVRQIFLHVADADRRLLSEGIRGRGTIDAGFVCDESVARIASLGGGDLDRSGLRTRLEEAWKGIEGMLSWPAAALLRRGIEDRETLLGLLGFALIHRAQHRGQLWAYLEMLGRELPRDG
ncbi:MAG: hypothetical protein GF346_10555 [Candidatus Eisenbacteria bacterium]|nr:hypothetical protein [Candidatus Latescibacterota bacterium]MBD3302877.1 hypothetical protein [Candidatus Eisenbacteria bacterium]